ncbi:MAG: T9SS type A sorting domain-containing protein [Saprospiraceae bacterium]|nr:T9SS type A sorting domain-containing protein [Saprospiraceae bacterium]
MFPVIFQLNGQSENQSLVSLDWDQNQWRQGEMKEVVRFHCLDSSQLQIDALLEINTNSKGSFEAFNVKTPYIDGVDVTNFGHGRNLGVMFDPAPGQGLSKVSVKLKFSRPVQYLGFTISDIDAAEGRLDSVVIFGNESEVFPNLSVQSKNPTVTVIRNSAVAVGGTSGSSQTGSAYGGESNGDVLVSFGDEYLDSITVLYYEASRNEDPMARGIGLFGDLSFQLARLYPMNLLKFGVVLDENCRPVVRWASNQEYAIDEYVVEYSYDGYNFSRAAAISAKNQYSQEIDYELAVNRDLNTDNYFRLVKVDSDGDQEILTSESISGSACFHFTNVNIYPNPSSGNYVYVEIEATEQKPTEIAIIDQYGALLVQTRYDLKRGRNLFKLESKHLIPGVYNLRFTIDQEVVSKRVSIVD